MSNPFRFSGAVVRPRAATKEHGSARRLQDYHRTTSIHDYVMPTKKNVAQAFVIEDQVTNGDPIAHIRAAIDASRNILELEHDWDGNGSIAYAPETWNNATAFVVTQALHVLNAGAKMPVPDIAPGPDGSIDLLWQEAGFRLLINVPPAGKPLDYWGRNGAIEVKGKISNPSIDHKELFLWLMKTC